MAHSQSMCSNRWPIQHSVLFVTVVVFLAIVFPASAQTVTGQIVDVAGVSPADAFDLNNMSGYHPSAVYKDDIYALFYHGGGPSIRDTTNPDGSQWSWWKPYTTCNETETDSSYTTPVPGYRECNDRVFMSWKHLSCGAGGACGTNNNWNTYPGTSNYPNMDYFHSAGNSPAYSLPTGITSMANWSNYTSFPAPYLHPASQPNASEYGGAGAPSVIYQNGLWFMAYSALVGGIGNGNDLWRMAWAYSTDGANWTQTGLIYLDDAGESLGPPQFGVIPQQIYYEDGFFYIIFTRLFGNSIYIMRSAFQSSPPYYSVWQMPTAIDGNGNFTTWANIPDFRLPNQTPVSIGDKIALIDSNSAALCWNTTTYPTVGFSKVYASNTSESYRYVMLIDIADGACGNTPFPNPDAPQKQYPLRLFVSSAASNTFLKSWNNVPFYDIQAEQNLSHATIRSNLRWKPSFVWLVPNATYTRPYNPITMYVGSSDDPNGKNHNLSRVQLRLSGDIY
jgi:hypothetical protein